LTIAGAGLAGRSQASSTSESIQNEDKLVLRKLGKTGINLPVVSMGTGATMSPSLIKSAFEKGIKLLATSEAYQNGNNERMIGTVLREMPRDSYIIMTSCGDISSIDTLTGIVNSSFTHNWYIERVHASLERLGVEYVDILIQPFAASRESVFNETVVKAMKTAKKEGLARYTGIATHKDEPEAIRAAVDVGIHDVVMTSYNFMKTNRDELEDAIRYADEAGLGIIAMKTMAGAFWDKERTKPMNASASLKWVLQNGHIHTAVPDCSNNDQLAQNFAIMSDLKLTEEEKRDLAPPSEDLASGLFCQQCGECLPQCPLGVDIPTIMRSFMYAYGHNNLPHAKSTMMTTGLKTNPCSGCSTCNITCKMKFDIKKKIEDITRIIDIPQDFLRV
jgi:predicted aldo/keto reductase-like oxidoreductase